MDAAPIPDRASPLARAGTGRVPNLGLVAALAAARSSRANVTLAIAVAGDEPPNEFCIFTAGTVETSKGEFIFDEAAAASVMADYAAHGIDLMIDYDHASLSTFTLDPAQTGKAAGWFNIELRAGELWAVNVRWTQPAAEALRRKEWRFMSPAFDVKEGHITSLLNVAITNIPATRRLTPLMAASATALGENTMSVEEFLKVCKALGIDMSSPLEEAMAKIKGESAAEEPAAEEPAAVEVAAADPAVPPEEDKPAEVAAALSAISSLSGKPLVASVSDIRTWHTSHVELATERKALAAREAVLENAERRKLGAELVTLAAHAPATVWADPSVPGVLKPYFLAMPIADFRAMHADAVKANGGKTTPRAPVSRLSAVGTVDANGLTPDQVAMCKETGCDPATFAMLKARSASTT